MQRNPFHRPEHEAGFPRHVVHGSASMGFTGGISGRRTRRDYVQPSGAVLFESVWPAAAPMGRLEDEGNARQEDQAARAPP